MEIKNYLTAVIAILLLVIAIEGAVLIINNPSGSGNDYLELSSKVDTLNEKGGKIYFSNGNYNELSANKNCVSINGDTIVIKAHDGYKETVAPISSIACIYINS